MPDFPAGDVLEGAAEIAAFLYGDDCKKKRRRIYTLIADKKLPHFKVGEVICARRSALGGWVESQEKGGGSHD